MSIAIKIAASAQMFQDFGFLDFEALWFSMIMKFPSYVTGIPRVIHKSIYIYIY